jgi:uncharacterized membrane protein YfcA
MNNFLRYLITFIIGAIGGVTSVYIGVSTSIMIPLIIFTGIIDNLQSVVGTTLIPIISPITIFPLYEFYKRKLVDVKVGLFLAIGFFISSYTTSKYFLNVFNKDTLCLLYGLFSIVVAFIFIKKSKILKKI